MTAHSTPNRHRGGKFLTIEKLNAQETERRRQQFTAIHREPTDGERMFRSRFKSACLTHIVRYVTDHYDQGEYVRSTPHAWCSMFPSSAGYQFVDPEDEMFACHKCVTFGEKFGADTFRMVPNTGCEATEGKRYRTNRS